MSVQQDNFKKIADTIRDRTQTFELIKPIDFPRKIHDVYSSGMYEGAKIGHFDEWESFWDTYQDNGNRTDYYVAFYGKYWNNISFKPKHPIVVTNGNSMFANSDISGDMREHADIDTSQNTVFGSMFAYMKKLTHLGVIDTRSATTLGNMVGYDTLLVEIEKIILKDDGSQTIGNFASCTSLREISFDGKIGTNANFGWSPLSKSSIKNIIDATENKPISLTLNQNAVNKAFETEDGKVDGTQSSEWLSLTYKKPDVTIALI